jgi:periplasmic divalent cation tolerance protein
MRNGAKKRRLPASRFAVVSTTVDKRNAADRLATMVVASRLAACVQSFPIQSHYWWKGKQESACEYLLLAKTRRSLATELIAFIRANHSYDLPEITVTPIVGGLSGYLAWIGSETRGNRVRLQSCTTVRSCRRRLRPHYERV